ncbi:MAG: DUF3048 domain-containing protein [Chloroflexi bacterium]|nr:DUF3048 domain-containing protein [Chloroflexota bacterium]
MRRLSKRAIWSTSLLFLSLTLLAVTACVGETPLQPTPTRELEVVVFATEAPTPTPMATIAATAAATATVGFGVSTAVPAAASSGDQTAPINRPPDVNPLTGLKVTDPAMLKRRPIMVRIGNDPGVQQVSLEKADIVYEEIVEWWVTRFTAIYLSQDPEIIAPIRSARLINLQLVPQYQGALANSGGSDQVRWELSQSDLVNLDEFFSPQPYFYRENEGWQTRLAFDAATAREYMKDEDLEADVKLHGFVFNPKLEVSDLPKEAVGDAEEVIIPYPQQTSEVKWAYDPASGAYLRWKTGEPMNDFDGKQLAATNVIIYFAEHEDTDIVEDSNGATSIRIIVNGLGTAWLLRDGKILKGNWETNGRETPNFIFNDGRPMPLKPGNTWVEVVPVEDEIEIDGVAHERLSDASGKATSGGGEAEEEPTDEPDATASPTPTPIGARPAATPTKTN